MLGLDKKLIVFSYFLFCIFFLPKTVFGASLYFESNNNNVFSSSENWYVDLMLDPMGESVNAISVDISFDDNLVDFVQAYKDDSIVTSWVDAPRKNGNHIVFSGIMAGGFNGLINPIEKTTSPGRIARFVFSPKGNGNGLLSFYDVFIGLNDGAGTEIIVDASPFIFSLNDGIINNKDILIDRRPPEIFKPIVSRDDSMFFGRYFLVFETKDRGVGVDHYEVKEGRGSWVESSSPYEISDQSLRKQIYVKAVDVFGNARTVKTFDRGFSIFGMFSIIVVSLVAFIFSRYSLKKLKNKVYFRNE